MAVHYVYRVFDADKRLIYVGCTHSLPQRLRMHGYGYSAWWSNQAVKVTAKVYPNKQTARSAEAAAIHAERPRWNITGKWATNADWTESEFHDFVTALLNSPEFGPRTLRRARRVADVYRKRSGRLLDVDWDEAERSIARRVAEVHQQHGMSSTAYDEVA